MDLWNKFSCHVFDGHFGSTASSESGTKHCTDLEDPEGRQILSIPSLVGARDHAILITGWLCAAWRPFPHGTRYTFGLIGSFYIQG